MIQLTIIGVYLVLLMGLGLLASRLFRGTSQDYMLASHTIGPFLLLMSLFGTTMTAFALVGSTGEAYQEGVGVYGMLASSSGIIHSMCFFLLGIKLWSFGRKYGYRTQIQFFRDRLENDRIGLLLFPILVGLVIPYLLIGVSSAGTVINGVTEGAFTSEVFAAADYGVPIWLGSLAICGVVLVYVFFGGMRGTAWANAFQTIVFMTLGVVTFVLISNRLGGAQSASQAVLEKHPSKLMREVAPEERESVETARRQWEVLAQYNWAVRNKGLQLSEEQLVQAYQQFQPRMPGWEQRAEAAYAKKHGLLDLSLEEQQRARIAQDDRVVPAGASLFDNKGNPVPLERFPRSDDWEQMAIQQFSSKIGNPNELLDPYDPDSGGKWTRRRALGMYRSMNWAPEVPHPLSKTLFFTYLLIPLSVGMFPHLFQHWLTAKSANTFKLAVVAHPIFIMIVWAPCVLLGVWATSAVIDGRPLVPPHFPPNAVLAKMVNDLTGNLLGGLLTAGVLAAIMSSLDSQFLCLGTMFTNDVVVHHGGKRRFTDRQQVLMARLFIVAIVAITYGFSLFDQRRVFQLGVWCFSGFSSLFPLAIAAVYWKRLTAAGAYASVFAMAASWAYLFWKSDYGMIPNYSVDVTIGGQVYQTMPVLTIFLCSLTAMVAVSLVTKPPSEKTLAKFFGSSEPPNKER